MSASVPVGGLTRGTRVLLSTTTSSFSFRQAGNNTKNNTSSSSHGGGGRNDGGGHHRHNRDAVIGTSSSSTHQQHGGHSDHRHSQHQQHRHSGDHSSSGHQRGSDHQHPPRRTQEYYRAVEALRKSKEQQKKVNYDRQFIAAASDEAKAHFKREQKSRIEAFLYDLRDQARGQRLNEQGEVESQWEVAVEAIRHAASCGAPISSDMIGEAIALCGKEKQFVEAEKLFYGMHYDYQIHRGAAATRAFFKVCEATGNFAAAHRLIEWTAEQLEIREKARKDIDEGVQLLAITTEDDTTSKQKQDAGSRSYSSTSKRGGKTSSSPPSSSPPPPLSSEVFTSYLRSISNTGSQAFFRRNWSTALSFYTTKRFHPVHAPKCVTTADLLDAIIQVQSRAADWVGAVTTFRRALVLLNQGKTGSTAASPTSSLPYVYDNTVDLVLSTAFKAKRHFEVVRTLQCAATLSTTSVKPKGYKPSSVEEEEEDIGWQGGGGAVAVPAGGGGYIPDEAAARMGIFSAEEVSATTYDLLLGTNIPQLMQERAYLDYTNNTFGKLLQQEREKQGAGNVNAATNSLVPSLLSSTTRTSNLENPKTSPYDAAYVSLSQSDLDHRKASWELSIQLFRGLADGGYPLFPQTYESPIRACIIAGKWEHAARMVMELKRDERPIPQQYIYSILCESVAHSPKPGYGLYATTRHPLLADYARISSLPFIASMRQAMALGNRSQFLRANSDMRAANHKESHLKTKITVDFGASSMAGNWLQALASFSRMSNLRNLEASRLESSSNFTSYPVLAGVSGQSADALVAKKTQAKVVNSSSYLDHAMAFSPVMLLRLEAVGELYVAQQSVNKERGLEVIRQRGKQQKNAETHEKQQESNDPQATEKEPVPINSTKQYDENDDDAKTISSSSIFDGIKMEEDTVKSSSISDTSHIMERRARNMERAVEWDSRKEENLELAKAVLREVRSLLYGSQQKQGGGGGDKNNNK